MSGFGTYCCECPCRKHPFQRIGQQCDGCDGSAKKKGWYARGGVCTSCPRRLLTAGYPRIYSSPASTSVLPEQVLPPRPPPLTSVLPEQIRPPPPPPPHPMTSSALHQVLPPPPPLPLNTELECKVHEEVVRQVESGSYYYGKLSAEEVVIWNCRDKPRGCSDTQRIKMEFNDGLVVNQLALQKDSGAHNMCFLDPMSNEELRKHMSLSQKTFYAVGGQYYGKEHRCYRRELENIYAGVCLYEFTVEDPMFRRVKVGKCRGHPPFKGRFLLSVFLCLRFFFL